MSRVPFRRWLASLFAPILMMGILAGCHSSRSGAASTAPSFTSAQLRAIVLTPSDLPDGFAPVVVGSGAFGLCDRSQTDLETAAAYTETTLAPPGDHMLLFEELYDFANTAESERMLQDFRRPGDGCSHTETKVVHPTGLDEDFASYSFSFPRGVKYNAGLIRSGSTVTILMLGAKIGPVPAPIWQAVVHAAELKVRNDS